MKIKLPASNFLRFVHDHKNLLNDTSCYDFTFKKVNLFYNKLLDNNNKLLSVLTDFAKDYNL